MLILTIPHLFAAENDTKAENPVAHIANSTLGWDIKLVDFYQASDGRAPLSIYARSQQGVWLAGIGTSRTMVKGRARRVYNGSWQHADMSAVPIVDGVMRGQLTVHMTPDLWIPTSGKSFPIVVDIDARLNEVGQLEGTYLAHRPDIDEPTIANCHFDQPGKLIGSFDVDNSTPLPDIGTLKLDLHGTKIGGLPDYKIRTLVVYLGYRRQADGRLNIEHASFGTKPRKGDVTGRANIDPHQQTLHHLKPEGFAATLTIPTHTLDILPCTYIIDVSGTIQNGTVTGIHKVVVQQPELDDITMQGSFDGSLRPGMSRQHFRGVMVDDWFTVVNNFQPVVPQEHPRLLFRKADLPALRARAKTPEGQAILQRLRYQLNAGDGRSMAQVFSDFTHAYMGGGYRHHTLDEPGVYTFSHVVGYGLLYQLTGDQHYADLGRQAMERALAGQRDRDDRYSLLAPGGALRAGPVIGWTAVGYDLCYDGWDPDFRQQITEFIANYHFAKGKGPDGTLDELVRGSKPPGSNHFGMQVGGATLALLAVDQEPGINQEQIDTWLRVAKHSTIRNVSEGFGNGGVFAEGDGTGSMATYISYLASLQAWRNVKGLDMIDNGRSEVPMMTLKWLYLSRTNPLKNFSKHC